MDDLLIKYLLGETTPDENARVREWLVASKENRQRLEQFRAIWQLSGQTPASDTPDKSDIWQRVREKMSAETEDGTGKAARVEARNGAGKEEATIFRPRWYRIWKVAAILAGIVVLGALGYVWTHHPSTTVAAASAKDTIRGSRETLTMKTDAIKDEGQEARKKDESWRKVVAGDVARVDSLPDGSVVQLSRGAAITYPKAFGEHRTIRLEGDASFDVTHDASHPFIVQTQDITIKVLGTSFDVFSRAGRTSVIMRTGVTLVIRGKDSSLLHACEGVVAIRGEKGFRDTIPGGDTLQGYPRKKALPALPAKTGKPAKTEIIVKEVQKGDRPGKRSPCDVDVRIVVPGKDLEDKPRAVKVGRPKKVAVAPMEPKVPVHPMKKLPPYNPGPSIEEARQTIRSIIGELVAAKVVSSPESVQSFCLERQRFIVNDQPMPDSLASRFQSLYIRPDGPNYYYGPVKVIGRGVFMDKKYVYP